MNTNVTMDSGDRNNNNRGQGETQPALAMQTQRAERMLKLDRTGPKTLALFTTLRCELTPERYEAMLAELASLIDAWRAARYRIFANLAEEWSWQYRRDLRQGQVPGRGTTVRLEAELHLRGPSLMRDRMAKKPDNQAR